MLFLLLFLVVSQGTGTEDAHTIVGNPIVLRGVRGPRDLKKKKYLIHLELELELELDSRNTRL